MNCKCFENLLNDEKLTRTETYERGNIKYIYEGIDDGQILLYSTVSYREQKISLLNNNLYVDFKKTQRRNIPIIYCPICGTKIKQFKT